MMIQGTFKDKKSNVITLYISYGSTGDTINMGDGLFGLADNPISIETSCNDTFDAIIKTSATITISVRNYTPELFAKDAKDIKVGIIRGDSEVLFAGYVVPLSLSQDFVSSYDDLDLNCVDTLSLLENYSYKMIGVKGNNYKTYKAEATDRTFADIIKDMLGENVYYDRSKSYTTKAADAVQIFTKTSINELLFFGDTEDDVWTEEKVLNAILTYFDLHIVQIGADFYIFSWATLKQDTTSITFVNIFDGTEKTITRNNRAISTDNVADDKCQLSVGDVYNQISLTCNLSEVDDIIDPPLESDSLTSPYSGKQLYMTELSSDGSGAKAKRAFKAMLKDETDTYEEASTTDWYIQVMNNPKWIFGTAGTDIVSEKCSDGKNQQNLPNWLSKNIGAAVLKCGKIENKLSRDDNSPKSKISMTNCLVVSVNGNGLNADSETDTKPYPTEDALRAAIPVATYTGNLAGGNFSPTDDKTTNYIIISGKVILNPIMAMSGYYSDLKADPDQLDNPLMKKLVPSRNNSDGRYYTRKYYKSETPSESVTYDADTKDGFVPYTDAGPQQYEFKYSAIGDSSDTISKVAVLQCMLIIGKKCVVETGTSGQISDFTWQTYKERSECASDDEYYQQSFSIGFDPKIKDKLIGTEFDLQNNIDYTLGLDEEGIAIAIKRADHISGSVKFIILGPVNSTWGDITRRHPTCFRHTKWTTNSVPLLAHTSSIIVKDFEIKVASDNGKNELSNDDNDIVYVSDTDETYLNKKDDLEFDINSALTSDECLKLGVSNQVSLSTPLNTDTEDGILKIYDLVTGRNGKPEQLYVDAYYNEWHEPRVELDVNLQDTGVGIFDLYTHPALTNKTFYTVGLTRDVESAEVEIKMREKDD